MKKYSGFTLIELVAAIIILAILSVIALPKFINLQDDASQGAMNGLKGALESVCTLTYQQTIIEGLGSYADETLSSGLKIRYGYPYVTQTNMRLVLDINEDLWEMTNSTTASPDAIIFTLIRDTDGMSVSEIEDDGVCKLTYNGAVKGERPVITISGCVD